MTNKNESNNTVSANTSKEKVNTIKKKTISSPVKATKLKVPKEAFSPEHSFSVGDPVMGTAPDGQSIRAVVASVEDDGLLLDHNHPLAGKDLIFEVELVEIQK